MCHMCEHNLQRIVVNEATKMIASLAPWSWQYQSVRPYGHHHSAPTLEGVMIHQGHKVDSCRKVSYLATWTPASRCPWQCGAKCMISTKVSEDILNKIIRVKLLSNSIKKTWIQWWHKPWLLVALLDQGELAFDCRKVDLQGEVPNTSVEIEHVLALVGSLGGKWS